jgi:hypothetical protein
MLASRRIIDAPPELIRVPPPADRRDRHRPRPGARNPGIRDGRAGRSDQGVSRQGARRPRRRLTH